MNRTKLVEWGSVAGALALLWLGTILLGVWLEPVPDPHDPSVAGVVAAEATRLMGEGSRWEYRLENGESVTIDYDIAEPLPNSSSTGEKGSLLVYGTTDEQPWYFGMSELKAGCFALSDKARDEGGAILFDNGLRLPKASDFSDRYGYKENGRIKGSGPAGTETFCINDRAEVAYYPALYGGPTLPTLDHQVAECAGIGLGGARLAGSATDPRVSWLISEAGGRQDVIWPQGYSARFEPALVIVDASGQAVYRAGDQVERGCVLSYDTTVLLILPPGR